MNGSSDNHLTRTTQSVNKNADAVAKLTTAPAFYYFRYINATDSTCHFIEIDTDTRNRVSCKGSTPLYSLLAVRMLRKKLHTGRQNREVQYR